MNSPALEQAHKTRSWWPPSVKLPAWNAGPTHHLTCPGLRAQFTPCHGTPSTPDTDLPLSVSTAGRGNFCLCAVPNSSVWNKREKPLLLLVGASLKSQCKLNYCIWASFRWAYSWKKFGTTKEDKTNRNAISPWRWMSEAMLPSLFESVPWCCDTNGIDWVMSSLIIECI